MSLQEGIFRHQVLGDPAWRLRNLYAIKPKKGGICKFIPNGPQWAYLQQEWYRTHILKARQLGFCLDPDTLVLRADLTWAKIKDLREGDEVVAVDEDVPGGKGAGRKMRTAQVEGCRTIKAKVYRVRFASGREIICTGSHRWLSRIPSQKHTKWRSIESRTKQRLQPGGMVRQICQTWGESSYEDGWMGGMIDGEGSLAKASRTGAAVTVCQVAGAVWDRLVRYAEENGYSYRVERDKDERPSKFGSKPVNKVVFSRLNEIFKLLGQTRPSRLVRRFWEGKDLPGKRVSGAWDEVVSIEALPGERDVVDIQTTTGTFIVEGLVSHNSTLKAIQFLDRMLFMKNRRAGIVDARKPDGVKKIAKIKLAFERLDCPVTHPDTYKLGGLIKQSVQLITDNRTELEFSNGSGIYTDTTFRGDTLQDIHISELGKISVRRPIDATEIISGALEGVSLDGTVTIESTHEGGKIGLNYQLMRKAMKNVGRLTRLDSKFFFFPWFGDPQYRLHEQDIPIREEIEAYFERLEDALVEDGMERLLNSMGIRTPVVFDRAQKLWYDRKSEAQGLTMKREYPSTPDEAFSAPVEGAIYADLLLRARAEGRVLDYPWENRAPLFTSWDLGTGDATAVWLIQIVGRQILILDHYEVNGQGANHMAAKMRQWEKMYDPIAVHFLPHDANHDGRGDVRTYEQHLHSCGIKNTEVVPRTPDVWTGIDAVRGILPRCLFHATNCDTPREVNGDEEPSGLACLEAYRRKVSETSDREPPQPLHDKHSHSSDALRTFAEALDNGLVDRHADLRPKRKARALTGHGDEAKSLFKPRKEPKAIGRLF